MRFFFLLIIVAVTCDAVRAQDYELREIAPAGASRWEIIIRPALPFRRGHSEQLQTSSYEVIRPDGTVVTLAAADFGIGNFGMPLNTTVVDENTIIEEKSNRRLVLMKRGKEPRVIYKSRSKNGHFEYPSHYRVNSAGQLIAATIDVKNSTFTALRIIFFDGTRTSTVRTLRLRKLAKATQPQVLGLPFLADDGSWTVRVTAAVGRRVRTRLNVTGMGAKYSGTTRGFGSSQKFLNTYLVTDETGDRRAGEIDETVVLASNDGSISRTVEGFNFPKLLSTGGAVAMKNVAAPGVPLFVVFDRERAVQYTCPNLTAGHATIVGTGERGSFFLSLYDDKTGLERIFHGVPTASVSNCQRSEAVSR